MSDGLVYGFRFTEGGGAQRIGLDEAVPQPEGAPPVWVHLDYASPAARRWLLERSGLDELVAEALLATETRPREMPVGDGLLLALRGVNLNPDTNPEDMVSIRVWIERGRIITTHHRWLLSVEQIAQAIESGRGPTTSAGFLVDLVERLTARIGEVTDQAEDRVFELEEAQLTAGGAGDRQAIAALRRQVIALRRYVAPQREALGRLYSERLSWLGDAERLALREVSDRLTRHVEDLDAVRERASVVQEQLASRLAEQVNQRMYVLSIVAGVFLPLGFLTGLLGINVGGIPGAEAPDAFWVFVALLGGIVALQIWLFRRAHWL